MIIYKIRSSDGMFSKGGTWPTFSKKGKLWKRKSDLTVHLQQLSQQGAQRYFDSRAEIVEYEMVEKEIATVSLPHYIADVQAKKLSKEQELLRREREERRKRRLAEYEQLKKEFEPNK